MALVLAEKETQFQNQVHFYIFISLKKTKKNQLKLRVGRHSVETCNLNGIF
jgi:hypothetical protein